MRTTLGCLLVLGVLLGEGPRWAAGDSLRCYTCISLPGDLTCLNDPDSVTSSVPITNCEMDGEVCCTITRVDYLEDENQLQSFSRGCTDKCPAKSFEEIEDATYRTYISKCTTPECNIGPGNKKIPSGAQDAKDNEIWGIKGIDGGAASLVASITPLVTLLLFLR